MSKIAFYIKAACCSNVGRIRKNNEDNFYFDGKYLQEINTGMQEIITYEKTLCNGFCSAVFDGMGGERFGETAAFAAAQEMKKIANNEPENSNIKIYLEDLSNKLDAAVIEKQQQLCTDRMGTTMICMYYSDGYMYFCNVGDSRAYLFRQGKLVQLSYDHTEKRPGSEKKGALTQYLGYGSDEVEIDPFINKTAVESEDMYLLCSDGLSDMLNDSDIADMLSFSDNAENCVQNLIDFAFEYGGRDNITVVVCRII